MKITHDPKSITLNGYNSGTMDLVAKNVDFGCDAHDDRFYFQALSVPVNSVEVTFRFARYNRKLRIDDFCEVRTLPTKDQTFAEAHSHMEAYFIIRGGRITVRNHEGKDVTYPVPENGFLHLIRKDEKWITYNRNDATFDPES